MKYGRGFQPAKIRHRLDIYKVTRLSRDVRWVEARQHNVIRAKQKPLADLPGVLMSPRVLSDSEVEELKQSWIDKYASKR